jgi:hypothetical protein
LPWNCFWGVPIAHARVAYLGGASTIDPRRHEFRSCRARSSGRGGAGRNAPGRDPYNIDALWARIGLELEEARLVQLDRIRVGQQGFRMRELVDQIGNAGRMIVRGIVKAPTEVNRQP